MSCPEEQCKQIRRVAQAIRDAVPAVVITIVAPNASHDNPWTLDAVLRDRQGVPPEVLRNLTSLG